MKTEYTEAQFLKNLRLFGLPPEATLPDIQQRYRELALEWHPDRWSDPDMKAVAEGKMTEINIAYDAMQAYLRDRAADRSQGGPQGQRSSSAGQSGSNGTTSGATPDSGGPDYRDADRAVPQPGFWMERLHGIVDWFSCRNAAELVGMLASLAGSFMTLWFIWSMISMWINTSRMTQQMFDDLPRFSAPDWGGSLSGQGGSESRR